MSDKIKLRAFRGDDGKATVKAILYHPMETGLRKDKATGQAIPAHFITEVQAYHNDKKVMTCLWGTGISKNPFLAFELNAAKSGDTIRITWVDNKGENAEGETRLS